MIFGRNIRHKSFNYHPKYYKPQNDTENERRIRFNRLPRRQGAAWSLWFLIIAAGIMIYVIYYLKGI